MPRDPMRALDDVPGPDLWDEITARAAGGDVPVDRPRGHRPLLAVAAVVVVLGAVAGGLVLAARGGDPSPAVDRQFDEQLTAIWGREWDLFGLVVDGERTRVPPIGTGTDGARPAGSAVYLDLTTEGRVGFTGCNGGGTQAELVDGRLVADDDWLSEAADCSDDGGGDFSGFGDDLMALDETMAELIQADPEVVLVGNQLTLTAGDTSARFFDPAARPPVPGEGDELVSSRGSDCVVGIRGGRDRGWSLTPGRPLSPDDRWLDDRTGVRSGLWEVTDGELTAEIQVPGQPVIDLVGERVEEVVLDDWGLATVWFRGGSVQVRAFPGRDDSGPCDAFTVTVAGPDETANRVFAVAVADQVLAAAPSIATPAPLPADFGLQLTPWPRDPSLELVAADGETVVVASQQVPEVPWHTTFGEFTIRCANGLPATVDATLYALPIEYRYGWRVAVGDANRTVPLRSRAGVTSQMTIGDGEPSDFTAIADDNPRYGTASFRFELDGSGAVESSQLALNVVDVDRLMSWVISVPITAC